jgi:hypothetical protein
MLVSALVGFYARLSSNKVSRRIQDMGRLNAAVDNPSLLVIVTYLVRDVAISKASVSTVVQCQLPHSIPTSRGTAEGTPRECRRTSNAPPHFLSGITQRYCGGPFLAVPVPDTSDPTKCCRVNVLQEFRSWWSGGCILCSTLCQRCWLSHNWLGMSDWTVASRM